MLPVFHPAADLKQHRTIHGWLDKLNLSQNYNVQRYLHDITALCVYRILNDQVYHFDHALIAFLHNLATSNMNILCTFFMCCSISAFVLLDHLISPLLVIDEECSQVGNCSPMYCVVNLTSDFLDRSKPTVPCCSIQLNYLWICLSIQFDNLMIFIKHVSLFTLNITHFIHLVHTLCFNHFINCKEDSFGIIKLIQFYNFIGRNLTMFSLQQRNIYTDRQEVSKIRFTQLKSSWLQDYRNTFYSLVFPLNIFHICQHSTHKIS